MVEVDRSHRSSAMSSTAEDPAPNVVVMKRLPDYYKTSQLSATIQKARDVGIDVVEAEARLHELKSLAAKASLEVATRAAKLAPDDSVVSAVATAIEDAKAAGVDTTDAAAQLAALRKSVWLRSRLRRRSTQPTLHTTRIRHARLSE